MIPHRSPLRRLGALLALACLGWIPAFGATSGLTVERFANPELAGLPDTVAEVAQIDDDWGLSAPAGLPADGFALRWTGALVPTASGRYQLVVQASGAVRVWVDEHLLIDDWSDPGARELVSPEIDLLAAARHRLVVEFADLAGDAAITLGWQRGPRDREVVPAGLWTTAAGGPGLHAIYTHGRDLSGPVVLERIDPTIDFDWSNGSPDPAVSKDGFAARWSAILTPERSRVVEFIARSDDGVRLRLDGKPIIERWQDRAANDSHSLPIAVEAGTSYALEMDYYENWGQAVAELHWREAYWGRETIGSERFEQLHRPGTDAATYSPFCLELPLPPGAEAMLEVDGEALALVRATPYSVFADVPLAARGPTRYRLEVDGVVHEGRLRWASVGLDDPAPLLLRAGDEILVDLPPAGELEVLEGSGLAAGARATQVATAGNAHRSRCSFNQPGYFTLRATFKNNREPIARDVIVVATGLDEREFAAEVGYTRRGNVPVLPEPGYVHWGATDGSELEAGLLEHQEDEDRITIGPQRRGSPTLIARLGGPDGPVLDLKEVQEFTMETLGKDRLIARDEDGVDIAHATVVITPFIDELWVELRMFAGESTFSGGLRSASFNTSGEDEPAAGRPPLGYETFATVIDPETGEATAVLDYAIEVVDHKACHQVQVGQVNSPYEPVSEDKYNNPKVCVEYCKRPATFAIFAPSDVELCVNDALNLDDPDVVEIEKAQVCYTGVDGADCPECLEVSKPAPGFTVEGLDAIDTSRPGTYEVTYRLQTDDDCVTCDPCDATVTVTVSDWSCTQNASITEVTIKGPVELDPGEEGAWTATATTVDGKMQCGYTGKKKDCPITGIKWTMSAGDKNVATNTVTRSWDTPGTYIVSATGDPRADCCLGSGTSGNLEVVVKCKADGATHKIKWDAEPIQTFLDRLKQKAEKAPNVKSFTAGILGSILLEFGEKCCPGDAEPTPYKKGSGRLGFKLKGEVFAPPPFAAFGAAWWDAKSPGWFGDPWTLGRGELKWQLGVFGGAEVEGGVRVPELEISECGNCVTAELGGSGTIKGGVAGQVTWQFWLGGGSDDPPQTKGRIGVEAAISTALKASGWVKVGSASNCEGWDLDFCWDGFRFKVVASLKVKGFGSFTYTIYEKEWASECD